MPSKLINSIQIMLHTMVLLNLLLYQQYGAIDTMNEFSSVFSLYKQNFTLSLISTLKITKSSEEILNRMRCFSYINMQTEESCSQGYARGYRNSA